MRAFIALEIPEKIKDRLEKIQNQLRQKGVKATWVKRQNLHLTLIFFADISPEQAELTAKLMKNTLTPRRCQAESASRRRNHDSSEVNSSIELKLTPLGAFPNPDFPKIIWIGLTGEIEKINLINSQIREKLNQEKIPFDSKPFIPHLTIARLRKIKPGQKKEFGRFLSQFQLPGKWSFQINQVALIKSQLTPQGPIYTDLLRINL
ncbi:MAG TPA: RNA 2',3'-cyclic phosphodiesterase [Candidatus Bathyarchaeia archaeon]|nr:RNA 2',3'-cyclic phosphodiesterase [Candidatus Bathyarchaeia archaeon]